MKATVIAALMIPILSASAQDYKADYTLNRQQADTWQNSFQQVEQELQALGVKQNDTTASAVEIPETEETVVVADKGLFFDAANSALIYLGNVRLRDTRAHINAKSQLHIYLENLTPEQEEHADNPADKAVNKAANQVKAAVMPAPQSAPAAPAATPAPVAAPAPPAPSLPAEPATAEPAQPAVFNTHSVVADSVHNNIFLYSPAAGEEILMQQGDNVVRIIPSAEAPARILADPQGNILLEGGLVDVCATAKEGGLTKLKSSGGYIYYHAATHTLHAPGSTEFTHPTGHMTCTEGLCIVLTPAAAQAKPTKGFLSQFTNMRFDGITTATAKGQVVMTSQAEDDRPAIRAEGDTLTYNGKTGACSLLGTKCRLVYGNQDIHADQGIHLLENGDIELRGNQIAGTYEREGDTPGQMLQGQFKARAHVIFRAETGTVTTEKGITLADAETDFSCTGPVHLVLSPREDATAPEQKPGMPNLAITRYGNIARLHATGNVIAHRYAPGTGACTSEIKAHSMQSDLATGETLLTGETGKPLIAQHEGNRIVATPAAAGTATMQVYANGDLELNGSTITATMVNEDGTTTAKCKDYVRLIHAQNRLETGSSTELHAPAAILTTNGSLSALLTTDGSAPAPKASTMPGFSGFRYNYNGLQKATTEKGCTLRTEQGSMQCTGPVQLVMQTGPRKKGDTLSSIKHATAAGNVALAGKDNTGRLIRATGDLLTIDAATGMKVLTGKRVTLGDTHNTHIITGKGAAVRIDANNNVKITGSSHKTHASNVREQLKSNNNKTIKK